MTVQLIHGDCLEIMPTLAAGSVDAVIADLPYGTTACKWDTVIPFAPLWEAYRRVLKPNGAVVLFGSQPFTSALVTSNLEWFRYEDIYDKRMPVGHLNSRKMPLRQHENIILFSPATLGNFTYNPQMRRGEFQQKGGPGKCKGTYGAYGVLRSWNDQYFPTSIISTPIEKQRDKMHSNQKPLTLLRYLVLTYTNPGETVLDNTMGSGTTGVACVQTGRNFIGIEQDQSYFCIAQKRIRDAQAQGNLFLDAEAEILGRESQPSGS